MPLPIPRSPQAAHQAINGTINANGNTGVLPNLGHHANPVVVAYLDVSGTVTGSTPSLTVTISTSQDGVRWVTAQSFTAVTATLATPQRIVLQNILDPYIQVSWAVSGAGATFNGVLCNLFQTAVSD